MKLTSKAIDAITTQTRNRLALELDCSVFTIGRWIKDNADNGDLTKKRAVQIISEESGIPEAEILEETVEEVQK